MLTDIEALAFDAALSTTDGAGNDRVGNHFVFAHAKTVHEVLDVVTTEDTHQVIIEGEEVLARTRVTLTAGTTAQLVVDTARFMAFRTEHMQTAEFSHSRSKRNISTTTSHVRCNRHLVLVACILDDFSFAAMVLGVQDFVRDTFLFEHAVENFGLFNGCRTHEERLALRMAFLDFSNNGAPLGIFGLINEVLQVLTDARLVRRNDPRVHVVNLDEFRCFGFSRTGHTGELLVHTEVVLERNRCKRLVFATDLHAFLGFDSLVDTIGIAAAFHQAARVFVDDDDFAVTDDVVDILFKEVPGAESVIEEVNPVGMFAIEVRNVHQVLDVEHALFGKLDVLVLFVDREVLVLDELLRNFVCLGVLFSSVFGRTTDDERRTGFVDQDGVDFVNNTEVEFALHELVRFHRHVVAEVVKTEFVVGTVSHVGVVAFAALFRIEAVHNETDRKTEELIDHAHLLSVTASEVIVHRHHMHAVARKTVQVNRESSGKRLTFTGSHFSDGTFVEHETTNHLHVERQHAERLHGIRIEFANLGVEGSREVDFPFVLSAFEFSLGLVHSFLEFRAETAKVKAKFRLEDVEDTETAVASFAANGKGINLDIVEGSSIIQLFTEFSALCSKFRVIKRCESLAGFVNLCNHRAELFHLTFMRCTKNLMEYCIYNAHGCP